MLVSHRWALRIGLAFPFWFGTSPVQAVPEEEADVAESEPRLQLASLRARWLDAKPANDHDESRDRLSVVHGRTTVTVPTQLDGGLVLTRFRHEVLRFGWGGEDPPRGVPKHLQSLSLDTSVLTPIRGRWALATGIGAGVYGDRLTTGTAKFVPFAALLGVVSLPREGYVGAGFAFAQGPGGAAPTPVVSLDWPIGERLRLRAEVPESLEFSFAPVRVLDIGITADLSGAEYGARCYTAFLSRPELGAAGEVSLDRRTKCRATRWDLTTGLFTRSHLGGGFDVELAAGAVLAHELQIDELRVSATAVGERYILELPARRIELTDPEHPTGFVGLNLILGT